MDKNFHFLTPKTSECPGALHADEAWPHHPQPLGAVDSQNPCRGECVGQAFGGTQGFALVGNHCEEGGAGDDGSGDWEWGT